MSSLIETLGLFGFMVGSLAVGIFFVWLYSLYAQARIADEPNEPYRKLQREVSTEQLKRRDARMVILEDIVALPKCPDGTLSPLQQKLYSQYKALEDENEVISKKEYAMLAKVRR